MKAVIENYINDLHKLFNETGVTDISGKNLSLADGLFIAAEIIMKASLRGNKVFFIGNGGSAAVASHKALDYWMMGKIRTTAFSDSANLTCISNDFGYENVFAKQIEMFADRGDVLMAISSSGNSENIVFAAETARRRGCHVFTFSGFKQTNRLRNIGELNFYTPVSHYNKVESLHLLLCDCILEIITQERKKFIINPEHAVHTGANNFLQARSEKDILVALDRDGTLIHDEGYFGLEDNWQDNLKFYDGCIDMIKSLNPVADVVVTTNQIGVARGFYTSKRVGEINKYIESIFKTQGAVIDGWHYCPYVERAWARKEGLDLDTPWIKDEFPKTRKPEIGMLEQAAVDLGKELSSYKNIFVIGDELDDLNMALNAGGIGIWFDNGKNDYLFEEVKKLKTANPGKIFYVKDLTKVIDMVQSVRNWFHL
ncbi:HAD-IIIA family hydrolase [Patescibacteria group bacterium]|nr:HAD-IIIA family hydrolase [Patescibacteria group bacterium]MBU4511774.1 HAD-IIIA family hydrolase [Patescibacteria group bacterium]